MRLSFSIKYIADTLARIIGYFTLGLLLYASFAEGSVSITGRHVTGFIQIAFALSLADWLWLQHKYRKLLREIETEL